MNEPLQRDDLDDQFDEEAVASTVRPAFGDEDAIGGAARQASDDDETEITSGGTLEDPTPYHRLSAAIKIVDLMVTEPLRIETALPAIWRRSGLDITEVHVGEGTAGLVLAREADSGSMQALDAWIAVLSDLRATLKDAEADDR